METYSELLEKLRIFKESEQFEYAIDICDAIIALISNNEIKRDISSWKEEKASLILNLKRKLSLKESISPKDKDIPEKSEERIKTNWSKYFSLLMKANTLESTDKIKSQKILKECLIMLKQDEQAFLKKYPNRKADRKAIEKRLK
ncbi:hypothetical protein NEF87_000247 [Candidatus Lokiarchaeum ossiferum]|uniref:Uncharacterized protein n=1 Tax=Candidatus Lokiarchaeum ossiferum TaxID=2951803 RepID=A0ABY6HM47_9ARCH|nr:hypothetical protein NEF87_000247 [Candidatus Lokiarchaeum sp. B-35]